MLRAEAAGLLLAPDSTQTTKTSRADKLLPREAMVVTAAALFHRTKMAVMEDSVEGVPPVLVRMEAAEVEADTKAEIH